MSLSNEGACAKLSRAPGMPAPGEWPARQ